MSKVFKDLGKDAKDVLSQDFHSGNTLILTGQATTPNNVVLKGTLKRAYFKDAKTKTSKEFLEFVLEPKYEKKSHNLEFNGKLTTGKDFSFTLTAKDLVKKGSKVEVVASTNDKTGHILKLVPSFKNNVFSAATSFALPIANSKKSQPFTSITELVFAKNNVYFGVNFAADIEQNQTKLKSDFSLLALLSSAQVAARTSYLHSKEQFTYGISFFHKVNPELKWAVDYELDPEKGPVAQVGGDFKPTPDGVIKARTLVKLSDTAQEYRLALSYKQQISNYFTANACADVNVRKLLGENVGEPHSFGLEIKLSEFNFTK